MRTFVVAVALVAVGLGRSQAEARGFRVSQLPNAPRNCNTCHTAGGGSPLNSFGEDVENTLSGSNVNWVQLCPMDSDNDGFSNGAELGDPGCMWREGDPLAPGATSDPANPNSTPPVMDAGVMDMGAPDTGVSPDTGTPDMSMSDAGALDTGAAQDQGVAPDQGAAPDAGPTEVGADASVPLDGSVDAGETLDRAVAGGCRGTGSRNASWPLLLVMAAALLRRRLRS